MAWIETVTEGEATGLVRKVYDAAKARAGRVFHVLRMMSPNGRVLQASTDFYLAVMYGDSPLTRRQRELLATVVSRANHCHY